MIEHICAALMAWQTVTLIVKENTLPNELLNTINETFSAMDMLTGGIQVENGHIIIHYEFKVKE